MQGELSLLWFSYIDSQPPFNGSYQAGALLLIWLLFFSLKMQIDLASMFLFAYKKKGHVQNIFLGRHKGVLDLILAYQRMIKRAVPLFLFPFFFFQITLDMM